MRDQNTFPSVPWIFIFQNLNNTQDVYIDSVSLIEKTPTTTINSPKAEVATQVLTPLQTHFT